MKCYFHTERDASGTCSSCNKAVCRECAADARGAIVCVECRESAAALGREDFRREARAAKRRILWSWILTAVLFPLVLMILFSGGSEAKTSAPVKFLLAVFSAYAIWSTVWGVPTVVGAWKRFLDKRLAGVGCFIVGGMMLWFVVLFSTVLFVIHIGYLYGIFGGAIVQYRRHRQLAAAAD